MDLPYCLFHKHHQITKFCECRKIYSYQGECTLPLCEICEPIHLQEHEKQNTIPVIESYLHCRQKAKYEL
jgi:hypothetical protein